MGNLAEQTLGPEVLAVLAPETERRGDGDGGTQGREPAGQDRSLVLRMDVVLGRMADQLGRFPSEGRQGGCRHVGEHAVGGRQSGDVAVGLLLQERQLLGADGTLVPRKVFCRDRTMAMRRGAIGGIGHACLLRPGWNASRVSGKRPSRLRHIYQA